MDLQNWTRQEKLALASVAVALIACVLTFVVPEVRRWSGLESKASGDRTHKPPATKRDRTAATISESDSSEGYSASADMDRLVADGRSYYVVFRPTAYVTRPGEALLPVTTFVFRDPDNGERWASLQMHGDYRHSRTSTFQLTDHIYGDNYRYEVVFLAGIHKKGYSQTLTASAFRATIELLAVETRRSAAEQRATEYVQLTARVAVAPVAAADERSE